ncbi:MAG: endoplasmic reticulum retention protein [Bogoriella megaspora]|nr:MAG: endoplasmic reticulum retention protein [Bogoriella megaspora]
MKTSSSASGISFKSQVLYLVVYVTRYLDLFWTFYEAKSLYNTVFKIVFIASSSYTVYLMLNDYKPTHDPNLDTFKVQYLLGFAAAMGVLFPYKYTPTEILWAFSIWLESVAILPQLFMLQRTGEAETITTHYLFALGAYRALYIPNWLYRYFAEGYFDPIAVTAGIIQTVLYSDFFYIYYTKLVFSRDRRLNIRDISPILLLIAFAGSCKVNDLIFPYKRCSGLHQIDSVRLRLAMETCSLIFGLRIAYFESGSLSA